MCLAPVRPETGLLIDARAKGIRCGAAVVTSMAPGVSKRRLVAFGYDEAGQITVLQAINNQY